MTRDDDFKRVVRRQARERGERYTEARARLQESTSATDHGRWVILRTFPGTEEQVERWLLPRQAFGVAEVLVPRFKERKFAPGVVLVRLGQNVDLAALVSQSWVTGFVGADAPEVLTWDAVRRALSTQARPQRSGRGQQVRLPPRTDVDLGAVWRRDPSSDLELNRVPIRPGTRPGDAEERVEDVAALDTVVAALRAEEALGSAEGATGDDRKFLLDQLELGMRARRHLLQSYRYLAEAIVAEHGGADQANADLMETAMAGLNEAISTYSRQSFFGPRQFPWRPGVFLLMATRTIRQALSELLPDKEVLR